MNSNSKSGWTFALIGLLVLAAMRRLDMLVILIPLAAVLAYGFLWAGHRHMGGAQGLK
jgi:hypothetical protein